MKSRIRVLIVADEFDVARSMCVAMTCYGHDVAVANDGVSAFNLASANEPDFVLLDLKQPDDVGLHFRQLLGPRPILISLSETPKAGVDFHFVKPVAPANLNELLTRLHRWDEKPACVRPPRHIASDHHRSSAKVS